MDRSKLLARATIALATIYCCTLALAAQQCASAGPQLDDIVRTISRTRVETRNVKPKLARCQLFVKVIREQHELASGQGKPSEVFNKLGQILEQRAKCFGGQPMGGGLNLLRDLIEDCRELIELRDQLEQQAPIGTQKTQDDVYEVELRRDDQGGQFGFGLRPMLGGVFVKLVYAGFPAAAAGMRFGDQLLLIDGRPAADGEVRNLSAKSQRPLKFLVRRAPFEQTLVMRKQTDLQEQTWGFSHDGGEITEVYEDSAAARAGLLKGMQIIAIDGASVVGLENTEFNAQLAKSTGAELSLTLMPGSVYRPLVEGADLATARKEANKIRRHV